MSGRTLSSRGGLPQSLGRRRSARCGDPHPLEHERRLVLGHRVLERDVARGEPHVSVARLRLPPRLVTRVGLEEATFQVRDRRTRNALREVQLRIAEPDVADQRAEALDRSDASEGRHDRVAYALAQQVARLVEVRVRLGPGLQRRVDDLAAELLAVSSLPRLDRRRSEPRPRRQVPAIGAEAAVAPDTTRQQRLGHVVAREQLVGCPLGLLGSHGPPGVGVAVWQRIGSSLSRAAHRSVAPRRQRGNPAARQRTPGSPS